MVDDAIPQEGSSQRDIRPFVRVAVCTLDHETTITIGILGPVQKVIAQTTANKTDRIDSHIVLSTNEITPFGFRCNNRDRISFGYVRRKVINKMLTLVAYRDTIGENSKLYIRMAKNIRQMQYVGGNTTATWSFLNHFRKGKRQTNVLVYMALGHRT